MKKILFILLLIPFFSNGQYVKRIKGELQVDSLNTARNKIIIANGEGLLQKMPRQIIVRDTNDFPTPVNNRYPLEENTEYVISDTFTLAKGFTLPKSGQLSAINGASNFINYTGTDTLFNGDSIDIFRISDIIVNASSNGVIYNVDGQTFPNFFIIQESNFTGFKDIGLIKQTTNRQSNVAYLMNEKGMRFEKCDVITLSTLLMQNFVSENDTFISISDTCGLIDIRGNVFNALSGEYVISIDPDIELNEAVIDGNVFSDENGGEWFAPGSLTEEDVRFEYAENGDAPNSVEIAYNTAIDNVLTTVINTIGVPVQMNLSVINRGDPRFNIESDGRSTYIGRRTRAFDVRANFRGNVASGANRDCTFYFSLGNDTLNKITAFADAGGGNTLVTTLNPHGLLDNARSPITNTINYNNGGDAWTIDSTGTNTFEIPTLFVGDDATGNFAQIIEYTQSQDRFDNADRKNVTMIACLMLGQYDYIEIWMANNTTTDNMDIDSYKFIAD